MNTIAARFRRRALILAVGTGLLSTALVATSFSAARAEEAPVAEESNPFAESSPEPEPSPEPTPESSPEPAPSPAPSYTPPSNDYRQPLVTSD